MCTLYALCVLCVCACVCVYEYVCMYEYNCVYPHRTRDITGLYFESDSTAHTSNMSTFTFCLRDVKLFKYSMKQNGTGSF